MRAAGPSAFERGRAVTFDPTPKPAPPGGTGVNDAPLAADTANEPAPRGAAEDTTGAARTGPREGAPIRSRTPAEEALAEALAAAEKRQREAEAEAAGLRERLAAERRLREDLVRNVGHELRTPLAVIAGFNKLLLSERVGPLTAEQRRFVGECARACARLDAFILQLIEAEGEPPGERELELQEGSLAEVIERVLLFLRPLLEERGLRIELRLDPAAEHARFHALRLEQVLTNLVGNALRYGARGGRIELATRWLESVSADGGWIEVSVSDDGPGVPLADRERIFEPWVRGRERRDAGLGLGLAICKRIVEAHGGSIGVGDAPGGGSRFHFTLPAPPVAPRVGVPASPLRAAGEVR
jgi:signal transduction histidine kinase